MSPLEAPEPTVSRLGLYLRCLRACKREGIETISSSGIEQRTGISSGQVRKDLSYFGEFGKPGRGYAVDALLDRLAGIMHLDVPHPMIIVGAGNLGTALAGHAGFAERGFQVAAIFDNDPAKIGRQIAGHEIFDVARMGEINERLRTRFGVIATPAAPAQEVANYMVQAGIKAILNFAPVRVRVPEGVVARNVDLGQELEILSYFASRQPGAERTGSDAR